MDLRPVPPQLVGKNFQPGRSGNPKGRPRRPDIYACAAAQAEIQGIDLRKAIGEIAIEQLRQAQEGDIDAANWVAKHLCVEPAKAVTIGIGAIGEDGEIVATHTIPPTMALAADLVRLADIAREHLLTDDRTC